MNGRQGGCDGCLVGWEAALNVRYTTAWYFVLWNAWPICLWKWLFTRMIINLGFCLLLSIQMGFARPLSFGVYATGMCLYTRWILLDFFDVDSTRHHPSRHVSGTAFQPPPKRHSTHLFFGRRIRTETSRESGRAIMLPELTATKTSTIATDGKKITLCWCRVLLLFDFNINCLKK